MAWSRALVALACAAAPSVVVARVARAATAGAPLASRSARLAARRSCVTRDRFPLAVSLRAHRALGAPLVVAPVCLAGRGPYPFLVDTGASRSLVTSALARKVGLRQSGPAGEAEGLHCRARVVPTAVSSWSLGAAALAPETVLVGRLPTLPFRVDGIIGSDELSRFKAVRLDYRRRELVLASAPGAPRAPLPAALQRAVAVRAHLSVLRQSGAVVASVRVTFKKLTASLVVDTGAAVSAVASSLVARAHLAPVGGSRVLAAFGCPVRVGEAQSGRWSVGGVPLGERSLAVLPAGGIPVNGMLGADVFSTFGALVVDYAGGLFLLGR